MWITERKLQEFVQSEMQTYLQQSGASLESAIAALKDCFTVDNNGNIDVTNSNFELYIGSTVTKGADEKAVAQLTDLVSGLYGVLAEKSAEDLRRFGFLEEAAERTDATLEQMRTGLVEGVRRSVAEYSETAHAALCRAAEGIEQNLADRFGEHSEEIKALVKGLYDELAARPASDVDALLKRVEEAQVENNAFRTEAFAQMREELLEEVRRSVAEHSEGSRDALERATETLGRTLAEWCGTSEEEVKNLVSGTCEALAEKSAEGLRRFDALEDRLRRTGEELELLCADLSKGMDRTAEEMEQLRADLLDGVHSVLEYRERAEKDRQKALTDAFDEHDRKMLLRARAQLYRILTELWSGKKDPSYNGKAYDLARKIKEYGEDLIADFCLIFFASAFNSNNLKDFLEAHKGDNVEQEDVLFILRTVLLNYDAKYKMTPWIKACKDPAMADRFGARYEEERVKFEDGTYDPAVPRDVFLAFNHEDDALARSLVRALEDPKNYGLHCFYSPRNLRQSTTWDKDLEVAMNHCRVFVFISTQHSRAAGSYTHNEMEYIISCDLQRAGKADNFPYEEVPRRYRTPRVEYLPGGKDYDGTRGVGKKVKQFFAGLTYYTDLADVCERVFDIVKSGLWFKENAARPAPEHRDDSVIKGLTSTAFITSTEPQPVGAEPSTPAKAEPAPDAAPAETPAEEAWPMDVKICGACGKECAQADKFCWNCGGKRFRLRKDAKYCVGCGAEMPTFVNFCKECGGGTFVETPEDVAEQREKLAEEAKRRAEEAARVAEEESIRRGLKEHGTFGSYPQTLVKGDVIKRLNAAAGALPTEEDPAGWTSYKYYIENRNDKDFMWYVDVELDGAKYRGVYFIQWRPDRTTGTVPSNSLQYANGYASGPVHWFRYEPIQWRVLEEKDGEMLLLSDWILDSREYSTIGENNYAESDIRAFLNGEFLHVAFSDAERAKILRKAVNNAKDSTTPINHQDYSTKWNYGGNIYACGNTEDYVFLLSVAQVTVGGFGFNDHYDYGDPVRRKKPTDYAKSQGIGSALGTSLWWLRSPHFNAKNGAWIVKNDGKVDSSLYVDYTTAGVVPALRVKL